MAGVAAKVAAPNIRHDVRQLPAIRILLVDPRPLTSDAVCAYLETASRRRGAGGVHVTAAKNGLARSDDFDLLLVHTSSRSDIATEIDRSLATLPDACRALPLVIYSDLCGPDEIAAALRGGARGYLPSTLDGDRILDALQLIATGLSVFPSPPAPAGQAENGSAAGSRCDELTARETEVLRALHDGKSNKVIARELGLSLNTVKVHVGSLFRKLGVSNRTEAALFAGRHLPTAAPSR